MIPRTWITPDRFFQFCFFEVEFSVLQRLICDAHLFIKRNVSRRERRRKWQRRRLHRSLQFRRLARRFRNSLGCPPSPFLSFGAAIIASKFEKTCKERRELSQVFQSERLSCFSEHHHRRSLRSHHSCFHFTYIQSRISAINMPVQCPYCLLVFPGHPSRFVRVLATYFVDSPGASMYKFHVSNGSLLSPI